MLQPAFDFSARPTRQIAQASLEAYGHVLQTLNAREISTFLLVCDFLEETGHADVTGGELAEWSGTAVTSIRPRLTGLCDKGWLHSHAMRNSRAHELRCHPVSPAVPREAIERLQKDAR